MSCTGLRLEEVGDNAMWKTDIKSNKEDRELVEYITVENADDKTMKG